MHQVELKILQVLGKSSKEMSTTSLVREVFKEEYEKIDSNLKHYEKSQVLMAKREKAQLHRKILYHLNKLIEDKYIFVYSIQGKGEKLFVINEEKGVENKSYQEIKNIYESITHLKENYFSGLEIYEQKEIIKIYDPKSWKSKINTISLKPILNLNKMYHLIYDLYSSVNDCISIFEFEKIIENEAPEDINKFLKKLKVDTNDFNKIICLHVNINNTTNAFKLTKFMKSYTELDASNVKCVFGINKSLFREHKKHFKEVLEMFYKNKVPLNIQNSDVYECPTILGRAGTYRIRERDWRKYKIIDYDKTIGYSMSDASIGVDVKKLLDNFTSVKEIEELFMKIARALLEGLSVHRKNSDIIFNKINELNKPYQHKFFSRQYNYIRLWNYDEEHPFFENFMFALEKSFQKINEFCKSEETIFLSCGIPINIKIVFSSGFRKFDKDLSKREYKKTTIKSKNDLLTSEIKKHLEVRGRLENIFISDRVRFFRAQGANIHQITEEFSTLLEEYTIPFFCYDFRERKGNLTLDSFFR